MDRPQHATQESSSRGAEAPTAVIIATTFPARAGDGTPEFVLTLARSLKKHRPVVVVPRVPHAPRREKIDGVEVRRVPYFPARWEGLATDAIMPTLRAHPWRVVEVPFLFAALFLGALRAVRQEHATVLNAHWIVPGGLVAYAVSALTGKPFVVTAHGADAYTLNGKLGRRLKRAVLGRASAVLPVSEDIAHTLDVESPVFRMGVDTVAMRQAVGERAPEKGLLVAIGRLADKKGIDVLLRAMVAVPGVTLDVLGDGPERANLEALADASGLSDRVRFLGRQPRDSVLAALKRADAVVIPSKQGAGGDKDGTPVVLSESMAAGVPVVASALGGLAECVVDGKTGLLVAPDDVDALAAALHRVAGGSVDLVSMGDAAAEEARSSLDIRAVGEHYDQVFAEIGRG